MTLADKPVVERQDNYPMKYWSRRKIDFQLLKIFNYNWISIAFFVNFCLFTAIIALSNKQNSTGTAIMVLSTNEGQRMFTDEQRERIIKEVYAKYPSYYPNFDKVQLMYASSLWIPTEQYYLTVLRVYQFPFSSVLYVTTHSEDGWKERADKFKIGSFCGPGILPIPIDMTVNRCKGPEDPRIYRNEHDNICISFNMHSNDRRRIYIYNLNDGKLTKFDSPILPTDELQKNWAPIKIADKIFYLYSYDPLRLMDCTEPDNCTIVNDDSIQPIGPLRSASSFTEVVKGIYFGFVFYHAEGEHYRPFLSVLEVDSGIPNSIRQIYLSEALEFKNSSFVDPKILIACSIARIDLDGNFMDVTVFFEDKECCAYRLSGVKEFLQLAREESIIKK